MEINGSRDQYGRHSAETFPVGDSPKDRRPRLKPGIRV